jgi:hypothetical protein
LRSTASTAAFRKSSRVTLLPTATSISFSALLGFISLVSDPDKRRIRPFNSTVTDLSSAG